MVSAQFKLNIFEGPLDLLLHLISKHKLNINDIEISLLLEQYLEYIDNIGYEDFDDAADFLEMAARLIYIKTCSLLPQDEEAVALKKDLEGRLIEYSLCKMAAQKLQENYVGADIFVRKAESVPVDKTYRREHDSQILYSAFMGLSAKARRETPIKADVFEPIVSHRVVSLTSKIIYVMKKLLTSGECDLSHIYDGMTDKSEKVATFLAILELTKSGRICLNDDNTSVYFNEKSRNTNSNDSQQEIQESAEIEITSEIDDVTDFDEDIADIEEYEASETKEEKYQNKSITNTVRADYSKPHSVVRIANERTAAAHTLVDDNCSKKDQTDMINNNDMEDDTVACAVAVEEAATIDSCEISQDTENAQPDISDNTYSTVVEACDKAETESIISDNSINLEEADKTADEISKLEIGETSVIPDEIAELINLPKDKPVSVFKPNYWGRLRYYWGSSLVSDDNRGNCWKYGKMIYRA